MATESICVRHILAQVLCRVLFDLYPNDGIFYIASPTTTTALT